MKSETIADIVREMREKNPCEEYPAEYGSGEVPNKMRKIADRIEAAASKSVAYETRLLNEITDLRLENARLRAALKPVLEVDADEILDLGIDGTSLLASVILDAQRIYNEGEAK